MRYGDLMRLAQDREQWSVMTAHLLEETTPDDDDDNDDDEQPLNNLRHRQFLANLYSPILTLGTTLVVAQPPSAGKSSK